METSCIAIVNADILMMRQSWLEWRAVVEGRMLRAGQVGEPGTRCPEEPANPTWANTQHCQLLTAETSQHSWQGCSCPRAEEEAGRRGRDC